MSNNLFNLLTYAIITMRCRKFMKKIILIFLLTFLLVGCSSSNYHKLNYEKLTTKLENNDTFILLFNNNTTEGDLLKNTLNKVLEKNNLTAYEINSTKLNQEQSNELREYFSYEDISIIFIKDGVDPSKLAHITNSSITVKDLERHLINLGFIASNVNDENNNDTEKTSE